MEKDDAQLIRNILSGDESAFSILIQKYQKRVHALAWRKIGDFHHAEEITQDTFLRAYTKLSTLKNPNQFAGWLYVIANRLCLNWMRKQKSGMLSLEQMSEKEIDSLTYGHSLSEYREAEATEHRYEIVQKLLAKLPESERTVMTLYYLGEMPAKEVSKFLGVSVKTIHSRLHRARKRLQGEEELLIKEALGKIQLPPNLTEHVMRRVADLKPSPTPAGKPLIPWAALGTATVLVLLLLGASNQYIARFQKPYSFEAASEPTVEIIDVLTMLDMDSKPAVRNQVGQINRSTHSIGTGLSMAETASTSNTQVDSTKYANSQWTPTNGPHGGIIYNIFATAERTLYAATPTSIYRRTADTTEWTRINTNKPISGLRMPMAEYANTLYIVSTDKVFSSTDNGETWNVLCARPKGHPTGLIVMDTVQQHNAHAGFVMYLALQNKGVFRSTDAGAEWNHLQNGLVNESVYAVAAIGNTVFAGTNKGLYHLNSDVWQQLSVGLSGPVYAVTGFENNLYIEIGPELTLGRAESKQKTAYSIIIGDNVNSNRILHSTDLGVSWTQITHKNESPFMDTAFGMVFLMDAGEILLPQGVVNVDENTFYRSGPFGIQSSTDRGKSWHQFTNGIRQSTIQDLVTINNRLYAYTGTNLVQSTNDGETWETVRIDSSDRILKTIEITFSPIHSHLVSQLAVDNDILYGIALRNGGLRVLHLSADTDVLVPVQGSPVFELASALIESQTGVEETKVERSFNNDEKSDHLPTSSNSIEMHIEIIGLAASGQTLYMEYNGRLFRWRPGDLEWRDTGLVDTGESRSDELDRGFKLAVSGETVYVGRRDGKLFQSFDAGNSWKDVTHNLPLHFERFNEIVFVGSTVYVATDTGVLVSQTGEHWSVLTDGTGTRPVIDRFAVDSTAVYGAGDAGLYRLDTYGKWRQVLPSVPGKVISLVVSNNVLYIATDHGGLFHISLEEEWSKASF